MEDPDTPEPDDRELKIWTNINAFGARCLGAKVACPYENVMHAMRTAFEDEDGMNDCRVQVASNWIRHGAKILLQWTQETLGLETSTPEEDGMYYEGGPLYDGPDTMCLRRWGFWMDRFEDAAKEDSGLSEETRAMASEAAATMKDVEKRVGNTL